MKYAGLQAQCWHKNRAVGNLTSAVNVASSILHQEFNDYVVESLTTFIILLDGSLYNVS